MVDTDYGAGIALDRELDLEIDATGDIESVDGVDELEKDISFQLIRVLSDEVGLPISRKEESRIARLARITIEADPRISQVESLSADIRRGAQEIEIDASVRAGDAVEQFVFEV